MILCLVKHNTMFSQALYYVKPEMMQYFFKSHTCTMFSFAGDEELDHWRKIFKDMADSRNRNKFNRKRKFGRGGYGGSRVISLCFV